MSLLVRVVDVMVLLWLLVLSGVVFDDALGDINAAGGDANGEGVVGVLPRGDAGVDDGGFSVCCCYLWLGARWVALVAFVRQFCERPW